MKRKFAEVDEKEDDKEEEVSSKKVKEKSIISDLEFFLELCYLSAHFWISWEIVAIKIEDEMWNDDSPEENLQVHKIIGKTKIIAGEILWYKLFSPGSIVGGSMKNDEISDQIDNVFLVLWKRTENERIETLLQVSMGGEVVKKIKAKGTLEQIADFGCRSTIINSEKIRCIVFEHIKKVLTTVTFKLDTAKEISKLLSFEETKVVNGLADLKRVCKVQQCFYFLHVERLIRLTRNFQLLTQHAELLKTIKLEESYRQLFPPVVDGKFLTNFFPGVISFLITEYCQFCWDDLHSSDLEEIFKQLLTKFVI